MDSDVRRRRSPLSRSSIVSGAVILKKVPATIPREGNAFFSLSPFPIVNMIFQSLLPPVPDLPLPNAHHLFFNRPDQAEWEDYIIHADALTGKTRKWYEFKDRVKRAATAFRNPDLFPYKENENVGIISENCIVRVT